MALRIESYSKTDQGNRDNAPPVGAPERNNPNTVNNIQRYMMQALAEAWDQITPKNTTTGTADSNDRVTDYVLSIGRSGEAPAAGSIYYAKFHKKNKADPNITINAATKMDLKGHYGDTLVEDSIEAGSVHVLAYHSATEIRVLTLNEYHEIRRGTSVAEIDSSNRFQYRVGSNVEFRVTTDGDGIFNGDVTAESTAIASDVRDKNDIVNLDPSYASAIVSYIQPISFTRKVKAKTEYGFSAQNIEQVDDKLIVTYMHPKKGEKRLALRTTGLLSVLWGAVQDLQKQVQELKNG